MVMRPSKADGRERRVTFEEGALDTESRYVGIKSPNRRVPDFSQVDEISRIISTCQALMVANDLASFAGHDYIRGVILAWETGAILFQSGRHENDDDYEDAIQSERMPKSRAQLERIVLHMLDRDLRRRWRSERCRRELQSLVEELTMGPSPAYGDSGADNSS